MSMSLARIYTDHLIVARIRRDIIYDAYTISLARIIRDIVYEHIIHDADVASPQSGSVVASALNVMPM